MPAIGLLIPAATREILGVTIREHAGRPRNHDMEDVDVPAHYYTRPADGSVRPPHKGKVRLKFPPTKPEKGEVVKREIPPKPRPVVDPAEHTFWNPPMLPPKPRRNRWTTQ